MVTKQRTTVNEDLMQDLVESYNRYGGFEDAKSISKELYMDEQLQPSISALRQLSPPSQELVVNLIRQLAERENIAVPLTPTTGLQTPADGMELWESHLTAQNWSRNTIKTYKTLLTTYLKEDPTPTTLSIKQNLAKKMQTMSPTGVGNYIRALKSLFGFLRAEGLWPQDPAAPIKRPKVGKKEREIPTEEEVTKLLTTLYNDQDSRRNKPKAMAWIITLVTTGMRRSELASLRWDRIDFKTVIFAGGWREMREGCRNH